jgi:thiol-disulfide isomerase/thioredoxin
MRLLKTLPLLTILALALSPVLAQEEDEKKERKVYPMPDFSVESLDGKRVDSEDLKGQVVLLDIWATWCRPCLASAPELDRIYQDYREDGLKMFGIAVQSGSEEKVKATAKKFGMSYPIVMWNEHLAERIQGIQSVPTYILIAQDWTVAQLYVGATPIAKIRKDVEKLLGSAATGPKSGKKSR